MKPRAEKDKKYEERHREERKAKSLVWGTSVPRKQAEEINTFLMNIFLSSTKILKRQKVCIIQI